MRISSTRHVTPVTPSRAVDICCWNNPGADERPKGNQLKQNLLKGVLNVVNKRDCLDSSICQNPELVSNLLNTLALLNWARVCSTDDKMCLCLRTLVQMCEVYTDTDFPVWLWNRDHTRVPVCGSFHFGNYPLIFLPSELSFYLIHQWQRNPSGS